MIYNLEKIDRVIAMINRNLGLGKDEIPYQDFIEWIADALEHIGCYYQFTETDAYLKVDNYRALLPCDFYQMIALQDGCSFDTITTSGFYGGSTSTLLTKLGISYEQLPYDDRLKLDFEGLNRTNLSGYISDKLQFNGEMMGSGSLKDSNTDKDYNINHNTISTSFKQGIIRIKYLAMPTDERGLPLVPDNVSYRDALFWRCAYHLSLRGSELIKNPLLKDIRYCDSQWQWYCGQARAEGNAPDPEMMERLKNIWMRHIVNRNEYDDNYSGVGKKQTLNFDGLA